MRILTLPGLAVVVLLPAVAGDRLQAADAEKPFEQRTLNVFFIGNSYTARHNLAQVVKAMAYLTACTIYAALFDRSPEGLPIDSITDIRYFKDTQRDKDRDGKPITRTFSAKDRADLQRIAWKGHMDFRRLPAGRSDPR